MSEYKAVVALTITGFECLHAEITNKLQVEPSKVWFRGDPVVASRPVARKHQENGWRYTVEITADEDNTALWLGKAVRQLMNVISAKLSCFSQLPAESLIEISCYVRIGEETMPAIHFDKETIRLMAVIGASIDVDLMLDV